MKAQGVNMGWFVHVFFPFFSATWSFFRVNTMVLASEQSELSTEATAEFLESSSLRGDDNLIGKKGVLGTCL